MPHARVRRNKVEKQLERRNTEIEGVSRDNVLQFPDRKRLHRRGNIVRRMDRQDRVDIESMLRERYDSAREDTERAAQEIERAEDQFSGLFPDWERDHEPPEDDDRIFMKKTMEHAQSVYAHLDSLTSQLDPLLRFVPKPSGAWPVRKEFERAKLKEILVDNYFRDLRLKKDILPRWRWNFLLHPSAFLRVLYDADSVDPDIRVDIVDRSNLYIDPWLKSGDIKDAAWVIERDWITEEEVDAMVEDGWWFLPEGATEVRHLTGLPTDQSFNRLLGHNANTANAIGPERDRLFEVLYYWQAETRGANHAHGVLLGGRDGRLVRWGPNPQPYKGLPYRGKSYLRDPYRVDGHSLAYQYRSIQEIYNTFLNLRVMDVLDGVKNQVLTFSQLFNEQTQSDHENNQRFLRLNDEFMQAMMNEGRSIKDFVFPLGGADSTQQLLRDLEYIDTEGKQETHANDIFRGQNPQSGATLGQVQEQLFRALGAFRPIFSQEMALIEELGEIINVYFQDPEFFGAERIAMIVGPNRYRSAIEGMIQDDTSGITMRNVSYDEMDVDVSVDAVSQAEHIASRTLRQTARTQFLDSLRHHPELVKEASQEIDFNAFFVRSLEEMGEDIEAIRRSPQEKRQRQQEQQEQQQQQQQQEQQQQMQLMQAQAQARGQEKVIGEKARTQGKLAELQAQGQQDAQQAQIEREAEIEQIVAKVSAENRAELERMAQEHKFALQRMLTEFQLEMRSLREGHKTSIGSGSNKINQ